MGNFPSVNSVPSAAVSQDIDLLKKLFPDKFKVESMGSSGSNGTATLFANDGKMTLILVATPKTSASATALVMDASDIKAVMKQQQQQQSTNNGTKLFSIKKDDNVTTDIRLPGGSVLVLVSPAIIGSSAGRQKLADKLTLVSNDNPAIQNGHISSETDRSANGSATTASKTPDIQQKEQKPASDDNIQLPSFPTLDFRLLQNHGQLQPNFPLNARTGTPFETDLFKGEVLVLLRPSDPEKEDPYWNEKIFRHKQRRIIVQVQGKFKKEPKGILYAGGEVSDPMKLGLLAKGLTNVLLKLLRSFYPTIHYSFGDEEEVAHIVVPAYRFFEKLIVTKPGETPPTLGEPFDEPAKSIKARKSSKSVGEWNTVDTYSMSFFSMYIDMPTWKVVNIPMSNDMPLSTFWGKSALTICFYDRVAPESVQKHLPEYNNYGFGIRIRHRGSGSNSQRTVDWVPDNSTDGEQEDNSGSGDERVNILDWTEAPSREMVRRGTSGMRTSESEVFLVEDDDNEDDVSVFDMNQFFDAKEYRDVSDSRSSMAPELLTSVDNLCPAWVEMLVHRGNYARVYAINIPNKVSETVFRKAESVLNLFGSDGPNEAIEHSSRISSAEETRRHLGQLLSSTVGDDDSQSLNNRRLEALQSTKSDYDDKFLKHKRPSIFEKSKIRASCFVARALSDHHWIEEWATITERGVNFYHPDRKKANHRVAIQSIVKVCKLDSSSSPNFPKYSFLSFETLGRTTYLMFASEADRDKWMDIISQLAKLAPSAVDSAETESDANASTALLELQNPKDEFLHKSSLWDFKHRRVLNCRKFSFSAREKASWQDPLSLAEDALRKALDPRNESDDDILVSFLDSAAKLKEAHVQGLQEEERLAFFLNVYHVMVMHAYLVLGTPGSSFQWISYFNSISYQCSDDIFSLAELEHCIIRSSMSKPAQFLSRFALPKSSYSFALTKADFRINFALNCGSMSNPMCVPIFKVPALNQQLDDVSRLYLSAAVKLKKRNKGDVDVFLPRLCQWFADDFGSSNTNVLKRVSPFFSKDVQNFIKACQSGENGKGQVNVKYLNYSFECRKLTLTPDSS